jgi:uncharacterized protein (DUF934 family)
MKKTAKSLYVSVVVGLFAFAFGLLLQGCAGLAPIKSETVTLRPAQTNYVPVVTAKTNAVITTNSFTTTVGKEARTVSTPITNYIVTVETNTLPVILPAITYQSNYVAAPWQAATSTIGEIAPFPYAHTVATGLLAVAGTVLGWMNRRNAAKAKANLTALGEAKIAAETLVDNFESLRKVALTIPAYKDGLDAKVMDAVKTAQRLSGVKDAIGKIVDDRTENTL